jgi:hypothetical protein
MGILTKMLKLKVAERVVKRLDARADAKDAQLRGQQQYIPAGQPVRGNFYQRNPKLVASLATVVLAGLTAALAKKRGMY